MAIGAAIASEEEKPIRFEELKNRVEDFKRPIESEIEK